MLNPASRLISSGDTDDYHDDQHINTIQFIRLEMRSFGIGTAKKYHFLIFGPLYRPERIIPFNAIEYCIKNIRENKIR